MIDPLITESVEKRDEVRELLARTPEDHESIAKLWKQHSLAEKAHDLAGLIATLTEDCVYELVQTGHRWVGHDGATRFYTELLTAFPDIDFALTGIVIGPQGVCEEAVVTGTHRAAWLNVEPTGHALVWRNVIFFPWDPDRRLFTGERVYSFFPDGSPMERLHTTAES